jgi:DnaJ domain
MATSKTHYQILEVDPNAPEDEIKKAYKRLARIYHPDLNPKRPRSAEDRFKRLQQAYDVLSDPISREQYDQSLGYSQPPPEPQPSFSSSSPPWASPGPNPAGYPSDSWTVDVYSTEPKWISWFREINWRRKLAVILWALCLLGSFFPASSVVITSSGFYVISLGSRLVWITIPLAMIWVGSWLSDEASLDMSLGTVVKEGFGYVLEVLAWIYFARLIGLMFLGPLVLWFS